jgi:hypothetical protein
MTRDIFSLQSDFKVCFVGAMAVEVFFSWHAVEPGVERGRVMCRRCNSSTLEMMERL